jgi:hypothetical protein
MNIFGFQIAVKKFVKWNTINFLNYALILRRSVFIIYGFLRNGIFDITIYDITYFFLPLLFCTKTYLNTRNLGHQSS